MKYLIKVIIIIVITTLSVISYATEKFLETSDDTIICVSPTFPKDDSGNLAEGWVTLEFLIGIDGKPTSPRVIESSGNKYVEQHALKEVLKHNYTNGIGEVQTQKFNYTIEE